MCLIKVDFMVFLGHKLPELKQMSDTDSLDTGLIL